ncbi:MAG: hypothetical protein MUP04_09180 [Anaerolineae bacterium]|nr:hypothetical protein [Anaerolineae bacterium]
MDYHFTVQAPFEPIVRESFGGSTVSTRLPDEATLPEGLHMKADDEHYLAALDVVASGPDDAGFVAIRRVEDLLKLLAAWNLAFRVIESGVRARRGDPLVQPTATVVGREKVIHVPPRPITVFVSPSATTEIDIPNLDHQAFALASRGSWSEALTVALDLNYLAVLADKPAVRFLLLITALGALAYGSLGKPFKLLSEKLHEGERRKFKDALDKLLGQWGLAEDESKRITDRVFDTDKEPFPQHLLYYLERMGITDYDVREVRHWWEIRGKIAHPTSSIEPDSLPEPLNRVRDATQRAIRKEVESVRRG